MILNVPKCYNCSDYGYTAGAGAPTGVVPSGPGEIIKDTGPVQLVANVPKTILFKQISVINDTKWTFAGLPACNNAANEGVPWEITAKTGTGFTVVAYGSEGEIMTFLFMAIKI